MCDALLSCDFLDSGLLGELKSLGEVVGLTLAVEGLGIFTLMDTSLRCLHETNKTKFSLRTRKFGNKNSSKCLSSTKRSVLKALNSYGNVISA